MQEVIRVAMADYKISKAPGQIITLGLGSCIGICAYEPSLKIGGMAHIMLPCDEMALDKSNKAKFANTAIPILVNELEKMGCNRQRLQVKIVGGAHMFSISGNDSSFNIGARNIAAVEEGFAALGITIMAN